MASKKTMKNQLDEMAKQFKTKPYQVNGWYFEEDLGDKDANIDHRANQIRLGFLTSEEESEAFHKAHPSSEFNYLGDDYLELIEESEEANS